MFTLLPDFVKIRINRYFLYLLSNGKLVVRVKVLDRLDFIAEKVNPDRFFVGKRENVNQRATQRKFSRFRHKISLAESFVEQYFTDDTVRQGFSFS